MIYYKITDKNSKAWNLHELFNDQVKKAKKQIDDLLEVFDLPEKYYTKRHTFYGFPAPDREADIPEGMRINKKGYMVPDRRTKRGKTIHSELKAIEIPANNQYMQNIFGVTASALADSHRMITGCTMAMVDDTVLISVHPKVLKEAQKKEDFSVPDGLQEITGSKYHELIQKKS